MSGKPSTSVVHQNSTGTPSSVKQAQSKTSASHQHQRQPSTSNFLLDKCRKLLVIRHGERIDFTFNAGGENWVTKAFDAQGKYRRFNINMPKTVPNRKDGYQHYALDTPLTEMGYLQAKITGRALKDAGVRPTHIYVSPALRCVQTCVGILKDCTIILVAHGASLDTCTRQLCGGDARNQHDFYTLLHQTPYLASAAVKEVVELGGSSKKWEVTEPPLLPFQHQGNASYNWTVLNSELEAGHHG